MRMFRFRINIKMFLTIIILFSILSIKIGYALLTQELNITGVAIASKNVWDVHFKENTIDESGSNLSSCSNANTCSKIDTHAYIKEDKTSIGFAVTFHVIGDYYQFTVDVVNDGTIDAMLDEVVKDNFSSYSSYLKFEVTYADGMAITRYDRLEKCGGTEKLKVKVTFINAPEQDLSAELGVSVNYIQSDEHMVHRALDPETRIKELPTTNTSIAEDDPDRNLRFIGSNPNNYVSFNGQKWRIIGIFDGKLKIVEDPIGNYSYDTSKNTVNRGFGVNEWSEADLMKLLNPGYESNQDLKCNTNTSYVSNAGDGYAILNCGDNSDSNYTTGLVNNSLWWNGGSGKCYNYGNYQTTNCDFTSSGLKSAEARNMIETSTWSLGSNSASENIWDGRLNASYAYNFERSNNTGKQCSNAYYCSDTVTRNITWQGKVGLIYPSDYIYATSGGSTYDRNTCLSVHAGYVSSTSVPNWNNTYTDCKNNDWLLNTSMWTWTISPRAFSSYSIYAFFVNSTGIVFSSDSMGAGSVRPVVYLKSSVAFTDQGDGTQSNPFVLKNVE